MAKRLPEKPFDLPLAKRFHANSSDRTANEGDFTKTTCSTAGEDTTHPNSKPLDLCENCSEIDLKPTFESRDNEKFIGFLDDFNDSTCPFCNLLWATIRIHWGDKMPSTMGSERPKIFLKSKEWLSYRKRGQRRRFEFYRPLLAITQNPPKFQLRRRRINKVDMKRVMFILAELELIPKRDGNNSQNQANFLRRDIGPLFDTILAVRWLESSKTSHGLKITTRTPQSPTFQDGFRVIDVLEERLVHITEPCQYLALSYVWGNLDPFAIRTTKLNVGKLSEPKALNTAIASKSLGRRVPRTINDAMRFTRDIGQRYLWVDSLCIIQDDKKEKERLIHGMNHVYENATLTLIAAAGNDAETGLFGITPRTNFRFEETFSIPTGTETLDVAICRPCLVEQVRKCHWYTRGWTYQEMCLSSNCLYFTRDEVFFHSSKEARREGYDSEKLKNFLQKHRDVTIRRGPPWWAANLKLDRDSSLGPSLPSPGQAYHHEFALRAFVSAVTDYSMRELSYPEDILNAFAGIYQRFSDLDDGSGQKTQGVPPQLMPDALFWFPALSKNSQSNIRPGISTWSWASINAPVDFVWAYNADHPVAVYFQPNFKILGKRYSFVDEWYLCCGRNDPRPQKHHTQTGTGLRPSAVENFFMRFTGRTIEEGKGSVPLPSSLMMGELGFRAACISLKFDRVFGRISSLDWHLIGAFSWERFRFDTKYQRVDELILISCGWCRDGSYRDGMLLALGVKNEAGVSKRVGFGLFSGSENHWEYHFRTEVAKMEWRFVRLK